MTDIDAMTPMSGTDDVIAVLTHQHELIKATIAEVMRAEPEGRQEPFDRLRALLAMHETAEEMVLRPATRSVGAEELADERNAEEAEATQALASLEDMDPRDPRFVEEFAAFAQAVLAHAQAEESLEFPRILDGVSAEDRAAKGRQLLAVEKTGPTHPHPSTAGSTVKNWTLGPFAAMVDKVRDSLTQHDRDERDGAA